MRRRQGQMPSRDGQRMDLTLRVEANCASRQRTAERAADDFMGVPRPPTRHPSPTAQQVAEALRADEQGSRHRRVPGALPLGFNPGQYRDEQRVSPMAAAAEEYIMTPPLKRQRSFAASGLMGPPEQLIWMGPNLTPSPGAPREPTEQQRWMETVGQMAQM